MQFTECDFSYEIAEAEAFLMDSVLHNNKLCARLQYF